MANNRFKIYKGPNEMVPVSLNFSAIKKELDENEISYDPSDDGLEQKRLIDSLEYEEMVLQILNNLENREKLIFVFQLLRDGGYQIDHGSFARAISLNRSHYMRILKNLRIKVALYVADYQSKEETKSSNNL